MDGLFSRTRTEVAPGAVHVPDWLPRDAQRDLVRACRRWATGPIPMRHQVLPGGGVMSVKSVCLGWEWDAYTYVRELRGVPVPPVPPELRALATRALAEVGYTPDFDAEIALVNFYDDAARMGMHQDRDEESRAPVVSISLGDSCRFRFGNTEHRGQPYTDLTLESGDLFVFGGPSRLAYHGVVRTFPGTGPTDIDLPRGRLNITIREKG
ncbi:alpha-ketoglutarate-dependent dioxygenase AlkB [Brevibacterium samyangense]|uniref:Alpha-ketoglutarate-dependent dioxygenase AlkB n=1 Tax=Brevibacterium samyangense TaxID=366888 RepID=A0ABN2T9J1_9MICO